MRKYSLYIFDLDGTLVDSSGGLKLCYGKIMDRLGFAYDPSDLDYFINESFVDTYGRFTSPPVSFEEFENTAIEEFSLFLDGRSTPYPETEHVLREINGKGTEICIATRSSHGRTKNVLALHNLTEYIDFIVGRDDVSRQKPDPECLEKCLEKFPVPKDEAVFVGDGETDIVAAAAIGMDSVYVNRTGESIEQEPTYEIETLRGLI
ncbi:MAG: HAD family hydrolase [Candidatus Methanomethylophilaceae archaeon]|jgi:phosphoglycolate phosphatase